MRISPLGGRRPLRSELAQFEGAGADDVVCPDPWLIIVGINPGLWSAAVNAPFAAPSNRFWPSLYEAGLMPWRVEASAGLAPEDEAEMIARGMGLTNLVNRATARASQLSREELRSGGLRLVELATRTRPDVVAVIGITAYREAFGKPKAQLGRQYEDGQPLDIGGAELWVLPQPSGLNAHATMPVLVEWWKKVEGRRRRERAEGFPRKPK
ncbi:mismatch-specific DNA-glycosylase [Trueperella pecoris]|uniref:Mismatch-specific DNA-glycosylase n=1 Tax=Trueperella pecoris TaxID=2733571 RepID=A0A7M1R2E9_9ACTO|nr:mismatch-specific DNA-glycosylase [Trueperella pecoris]QOR47884.1 mismatch-specific DNA-glycosylase [Trueperella pecoris]